MCYNIFLLNWNLGRQKADLTGGERPYQCLCPCHSFCMSVDEALDSACCYYLLHVNRRILPTWSARYTHLRAATWRTRNSMATLFVDGTAISSISS